MAAGDMVQLAASVGDIDTSDQLQRAAAYGKVFIANGANLKVADFQNTKIATADIGANPPDRGNILTDGTSGATMIVDYITSIADACTIYGLRQTAATFGNGNTVTGTDDDGNAISFTLSAAETAPPHWYNWTVYGNSTGDALTAFGSMPSKAYLVALTGGRLVLWNPDYPSQAPTSAAGNPWDWNRYRTTADRATVIGTGAAGAIGDEIRALIPIRDGQFVLGCATSMHVMVGNPAFGGQLVAVDETVGIFDGTSWCFDGEGNLFFFGTGGLHRMDRGALTIDNLSRGPLPNLISDEGADPSTHRVTMEYDPIRVGIKISITLLADGTNSNYWYDLLAQAFDYDAFDSDHGAYSMFYYDANDPDNRGLLIGCTDGYIRVHDDTATNDDGIAIDSYVTIGPLALGDSGKAGSLAAFDIVLAGGASGGSAADSDGVTLTVWAEDTAEETIEKLVANTSPKLSMTFSGPGRKRGGKRRRGVRGAYAGLRIGNSTISEEWGFEKIILDSGFPGRRLQ